MGRARAGFEFGLCCCLAVCLGLRTASPRACKVQEVKKMAPVAPSGSDLG